MNYLGPPRKTCPARPGALSPGGYGRTGRLATGLLAAGLLAAVVLLPSAAQPPGPFRPALPAPTPPPTTSPSPTPIPWDDIQVNEHEESYFCSNEALALAGEDVYVVYDSGSAWEGIWFSHSSDGGQTFLPSTHIHPEGSKAAIARREGAGPEEEDLYVTFYKGYRVYFTRSPDEGATWLAPLVVYDGAPEEAWVGHPKIAVDAGGTIYLTWRKDSGGYHSFYLSRSGDGGGSWSAPSPITPEPYVVGNWTLSSSLQAAGGVLYFAWNGTRVSTWEREVMFTHSSDGGESWSGPARVDDDEYPARDVDIALGADGTIYAAWGDRRLFGSGHDLTYVNHSSDGGQSWSPGVRVDDAGDCVKASLSGAITVDDTTSSLHVALSDGRNYCHETYYLGWTDIFYTYSTDGGSSWSENEQISNPVFHNYAGDASIQTRAGRVYTTFNGKVSEVDGRAFMWLDIHDPGLPPVTASPAPSPTASPTPGASPTSTGTVSPPASATPTPTTPQEWKVGLPLVGRGGTR